jgi:BASS family bile acid:Na+ symporter
VSKLSGLFRDRNFILALAIVLGLALGQGSLWTKALVLPALAFVMMLSMTGVEGRLFRSPRRLLTPLLAGVTLNYIVQGGLTLLLSALLIREEPFRVGFVLLAAVPSAVGVIPFTGFLDGDVEFSIVATLGNYISAFVATPLILYLLLGSGGDLQIRLITTMAQVIILPLILSRVLVYTGISDRMARVRGPIINWCFFLVIYTTVGLNRHVFATQPLTLIPAAAITVATTYLLGTAIERGGRLLEIDPKRVTSMVLLGTSKNAGFAAGLALTLFGGETAVPSTVQTISMLTYVIYLDLRKRQRKNPPHPQANQ